MTVRAVMQDCFSRILMSPRQDSQCAVQRVLICKRNLFQRMSIFDGVVRY
jgi:hypothetical protein